MFWNKYTKLLFIILLVTVTGFAGIFTTDRDDDKFSKPGFSYKIYSYPLIERDSVFVSIILDIPYNELQFVKAEDRFRADYEATVLVLDKEGQQAFSEIRTDTVFVNDFEKTNSIKLMVNYQLDFKLLPGKYVIRLGIRDVHSKKRNFVTKTFDYKDYYKESVIISEMKIEALEKEKKDSTTESSIFADPDKKEEKIYELSYKVLSDGGLAKIIYRITDTEEKEIFNQSYDKLFDEGITNLKFIFDAANLQYKEYIVHVTIKLDNESVTRKKRFRIRWTGMNVHIRDIENAIEQLVYITDHKTIKKMQKAKGEEQKELFLEFWKSKDPTPGTVKNELMNEYYSRVRYANHHFEGHRKGWRSDMGMVYILFGAPDNVERHPFEVNSRPYEIWYYNNKGKVFYFIDETGFGDYRLANPSQIYY